MLREGRTCRRDTGGKKKVKEKCRRGRRMNERKRKKNGTERDGEREAG